MYRRQCVGRVLAATAAALLVGAASAHAQPCPPGVPGVQAVCGDCGNDGRVTVDDLVRGVAALLNGCTAPPVGCPFDLNDDFGQGLCLYAGAYRFRAGRAGACPADPSATALVGGDGQTVHIALPLLAGLQATVGQLCNFEPIFRADLVAPTTGQVLQRDDRATLIIAPDAPIPINPDCAVEGFEGTYAGIASLIAPCP